MNHTQNLHSSVHISPTSGAGGLYIIAIDQSTSATKVMLFDETSKLIHRVSKDHHQYYPQPGWVEHDAEEILENTLSGLKQLLEETRVNPQDILSLSITNQRETVVVWDKNSGKPVYNAVVWQCNRGTQICEKLISEGH
jgi:glycerol kinase